MGSAMSAEQKTAQDASLVPFDPPLGLHGQYCSPALTTLVMREKYFSWSGQDFTVRTTEGRLVLRCDAKAFSIRDRKEYLDESGQLLFVVKRAVFHIPAVYYAEDSSGKNLFTAKGKFSFPSTKMHCSFTNASTQQEIELVCSGDFINRRAKITLDGRPLAFIRRNFWNAREWVSAAHTYYVTVAPGVDLTLVAALCICMDDRESNN